MLDKRTVARFIEGLHCLTEIPISLICKSGDPVYVETPPEISHIYGEFSRQKYISSILSDVDTSDVKPIIKPLYHGYFEAYMPVTLKGQIFSTVIVGPYIPQDVAKEKIEVILRIAVAGIAAMIEQAIRLKSRKACSIPPEKIRELRLFERAIELFSEIIIICDRDMRIVHLNTSALQFYGTASKHNVLGRRNDELSLPEKLSESWQEQMKKSMLTGLPGELEIEYPDHPDTRYYILRVIPVNDISGQKYMITIARDVTGYHLIEANLRRVNDLNQVISELSSKLIYMPHNKMEDTITESLSLLAGYSGAQRAYIFFLDDETATAQKRFEWCEKGVPPHLEDLANLPMENLEPWLKDLAKGKNVYFRDMQLLRSMELSKLKALYKDDLRTMLLVPMLNNAHLLGFMGFDSISRKLEFSSNIIRLLRLSSEIISGTMARQGFEDKMIKARNDAIKANRSKSMFLANMSHEIRTPMNGIMGMASLLSETDLGKKQKNYVTTIQNSADSLLSIINDILDFSKIEVGKVEIDITEFNVESILGDLADLLSLKAFQKNLEFIIYIDPKLPVNLIGDPARIRQILINITGNAIKFTETGQVEIRVESAGRISHGDSVRTLWRVRDTGIGIPEDKQGLIFEEFNQADPSTTRKFGGTGLGLTISRKLVELMGGDIWLESSTEGTTFSFMLDLGSGVPEITEKNSGKILMIDSNPSVLDTVSTYLSAGGFDVWKEQRAEDGLKILWEEDIDILIFDECMKGINGSTIVRIIESDERLKDIKLIFTSTKAGCIKTGAIPERVSMVLGKPLLPNALLKAIEDLKNGLRDEDERKRAVAQSYAIGEGFRILLAEDNRTNRMVAKGILENRGFTVDAVENGEEAVEAAERISYDLILMDIQMPGMDGVSAMMEIRSRLDDEQLPIIAMTAHALKGDREKYLDSGMNDYISKPFHVPELISTIARWIDKDVPTDKSPEEPIEVIFDLDSSLERVDGNLDLLKRIIEVSYGDIDEQMAILEDSYDMSDWEELKRSAHTLKGVAGNVGAMRVYMLARNIEGDVKKEQYQNLSERIVNLSEEIEIWRTKSKGVIWEKAG